MAERFLAVLLVFYIAKQVLVALIFPPFTGHDEVAHYAYIQTIVEERRIPVIAKAETIPAQYANSPETWNFLYQDYLPNELYPYCRFVLQWFCLPDEARWRANPPKLATWGPRYEAQGVLYTANHPPLYYLLMSPIFWLADRFEATPELTQYLLRLAVIPFGVLTVLWAFQLTRTLFPHDAFLLVTVPTFVALQTQVSYEAAMVNNDIVAIAMMSGVLALVAVGVRDRFPYRVCVGLGVLLGLGLLAKATSVVAVGVVGLALLLGLGVKPLSRLVRSGLLIGIPTVVLAAPWYIFMYRTYGSFGALDQVLELQWRINSQPAQFFDMILSWGFVARRFGETWGEFGWRVLPLDSELLWMIAIPLIIAIAGLVWYAAMIIRPNLADGDADPVLAPTRWRVVCLIVLLATCVASYLAVIQFGTQFNLTQARYYFPAINAATLLLMLGFRTVVPTGNLPVARVGIVALLLLLNVYIVTAYVIPHYHLST